MTILTIWGRRKTNQRLRRFNVSFTRPAGRHQCHKAFVWTAKDSYVRDHFTTFTRADLAEELKNQKLRHLPGQVSHVPGGDKRQQHPHTHTPLRRLLDLATEAEYTGWLHTWTHSDLPRSNLHRSRFTHPSQPPQPPPRSYKHLQLTQIHQV